MKKSWPKGVLLAAAVVFVAIVGQLSGFNQYVVTKFNDVQVDDLKLAGNDILDSNGTTRITTGATNAITGNLSVSGTAAITGNMTVTGSLTTAGTTYFTLQISSAPRDSLTGITPTSRGQLVYNSTDKELCMSTGTTLFTWVEVATATVSACKH